MHVRGGMNKRLQAIHPAHDMTPGQIRELLLTRESVYIGNRDTIIADIYCDNKNRTILQVHSSEGWKMRYLHEWTPDAWIYASSKLPKIVSMFEEDQ